MTEQALLPIMDVHCHCGNVTACGGRRDDPSTTSRVLCCLLCRCKECHGDIRPTDEFPGCGPYCVFHKSAVREVRIRQAESRADEPVRLESLGRSHTIADRLALSLLEPVA